MVMDENSRNGRKWYLAQQITQPVIGYVLSSTTTSTTCNHTKNNNSHNRMLSIITIHTPYYMGKFFFIYNQIDIFNPKFLFKLTVCIFLRVNT